MFNVYIQGQKTEFNFRELESAMDYAFKRIAEITVKSCKVWIETDKGEKLALMN